jgi:SAM-dependent methyltransferase
MAYSFTPPEPPFSGLQHEGFCMRMQAFARAAFNRAKSALKDIALDNARSNRFSGSKIVISDSTERLLSLPLSTPAPPEDLVYAVNGHRDAVAYTSTRTPTARRMIEMLAECGIDFAQFRTLLDFGCGCGRILSAWEHFTTNGLNLIGFDINQSLIEFCQRHIPFAKTERTSYYPPLPVADSSVDFAYAASVWTHLSLAASQQWAGEFARVIRPGGIAMASYHGTYFAPVVAKLSKDGSQLLEEEGFYIHAHRPAVMTYEGSNSYATFMSSAFFRALFVGFEVVRLYPGVSHGPNPFASFQDIAILRRM